MTLPNEFYTIIKDSWPMLLIFMIVTITIKIAYAIERKEKFVLYKEFFSLAVMMYILLLFGLVTNTDVQGVSNNFVPFREILRYKIGSKYFIWNVIGNICIFAPFGFFMSIYLDSKKITFPLIVTFISSLTIEVVQRFIGRSFDIDDIILNCVGGAIGFIIYIILKAIKDRLPKFLQSEIVYNILTLLLIILIIYYIFVYQGGILGWIMK